MSLFYEIFYPEISLEEVQRDFAKDETQYRDATTRYTDKKTGIRAIYSFFRRSLIFIRRKDLEKNKNGKISIDCAKIPKTEKITINDYMFCDTCQKHKSYHSLISPCRFVEKSNEPYRKIVIPDWINIDELELVNKERNDIIKNVSEDIILFDYNQLYPQTRNKN